MKNLELLIRESMKKEGIDLIGFASKSRFEGVDPQNDPFAIFPEGKTVILLGKRICRGSLRGVEEGTNFGDYRLFGQNWLEDEFLSLACYNLVRVLEDEGWEAVPVFPNPAEIRPSGVSVAEGRPEPNVFPDFTYAAVACGIAEIGFSGLLLTPKFGSRQRFHMIITDAEIEDISARIVNAVKDAASVPMPVLSVLSIKTTPTPLRSAAKRWRLLTSTTTSAVSARTAPAPTALPIMQSPTA